MDKIYEKTDSIEFLKSFVELSPKNQEKIRWTIKNIELIRRWVSSEKFIEAKGFFEDLAEKGDIAAQSILFLYNKNIWEEDKEV